MERLPRKALPRSGLAEGDWLAKAAKDALTAGCLASVFDAMFSALGSGGEKSQPCAPAVVSDRILAPRTRLSAGRRRRYLACSNPPGWMVCFGDVIPSTSITVI